MSNPVSSPAYYLRVGYISVACSVYGVMSELLSFRFFLYLCKVYHMWCGQSGCPRAISLHWMEFNTCKYGKQSINQQLWGQCTCEVRTHTRAACLFLHSWPVISPHYSLFKTKSLYTHRFFHCQLVVVK